MVKKPYMGTSRARATLNYHLKVELVHGESEEVGVAELKVWSVPKSKNYPQGLKYSLFLVNTDSGDVILGVDNHKPKGHHFHYGKKEETYQFSSTTQLIEDFWNLAKEEGFEV